MSNERDAKADCDWLYDIVKVASDGLPCEAAEMLEFGECLGYRIEIRRGEARWFLDVPLERMTPERRGSTEVILRERIYTLLKPTFAGAQSLRPAL